MDENAARAALRRYIEYSGVDQDISHEIYHDDDDAVLEFPQSGERFEGLENFREWRRIHPAKTEFEIRRLRGSGDPWVMELIVTYDGGTSLFGVSVFEFRGDEVSRETIYGGEPWDAPEWRARWRAVPPPVTD